MSFIERFFLCPLSEVPLYKFTLNYGNMHNDVFYIDPLLKGLLSDTWKTRNW